MTLHPQAQAFIDMIAQQSPPGWEDLPVEESREIFNGFDPFLGEAPPLKRVEDHVLGGVSVRLYSDTSEPSPLVMFFHGGGWVLGNLESHDPLCRRLAKHSGCTLVSVDYRLAPESPFPGPMDDCYLATQLAIENAEQLAVNAEKVAVAGDSAGGNLAAAVALEAQKEHGPDLALQVLIYPVIEPNFETESYKAFGEGHGLTAANMRWFWDQYMGDEAVRPSAAPSTAASHQGLPAAHVITAEYDILRDEGNAYAEKLQAAGVPVSHRCYEGMLHGFVHLAGMFDDGMQANLDIADVLKTHLC